MGYSMYLAQGKFRMLKARTVPAFAAYRAAYGGDAADLSAALLEQGWETEEHPETGDLTNLHFIGEKAHDEDTLFGVLAPYVERGSFLVMHGEDEAIWRWYFTGRKLVTDHAVILFRPRVDLLVRNGKARVLSAPAGIRVRVRYARKEAA